MEGDMDYRLRLLQQAGTYLTPDDDGMPGTGCSTFSTIPRQARSRRMRCSMSMDARFAQNSAPKGIAWFEFGDICDGPRSQNDYIEIARWYPTVIVSGIPKLGSDLENQARRLIALVDEFYDRRVKLILSAAAPIDTLYAGQRLDFEFERTVSRLIEMQSTDYLAAPHLA